MAIRPARRKRKNDRKAADAFGDLLALVDHEDAARWQEDKRCEDAARHFAYDAVVGELGPMLWPVMGHADVHVEQVGDRPDTRGELLGADAREFLGALVPVFVKSEVRRGVACWVASAVGLVVSGLMLVGAVAMFVWDDPLSGVELLLLCPVPWFLGRLSKPLLDRITGCPTDWVQTVVAATCATEHADDQTRERARALMREYVERDRSE